MPQNRETAAAIATKLAQYCRDKSMGDWFERSSNASVYNTILLILDHFDEYWGVIFDRGELCWYEKCLSSPEECLEDDIVLLSIIDLLLKMIRSIPSTQLPPDQNLDVRTEVFAFVKPVVDFYQHKMVCWWLGLGCAYSWVGMVGCGAFTCVTALACGVPVLGAGLASTSASLMAAGAGELWASKLAAGNLLPRIDNVEEILCKGVESLQAPQQ